nr:retrovirus-related Pol polyprotein from transposon TNT 1-94 [Tanacetum cinerariifolium]
IKLKRKRRKRKSSKQNVKQVDNDVSLVNNDFVHFLDLDTFSSVRRPRHRDVIWKKKGSSNTSHVDLSSVSHLKLNKNVKRYSRKDLLSCNNSHLGETTSAFVCNDDMNVSCDSRMNDLLFDNNFFIFDDVNVRISLVSKMPFRKKPCDSMHVRSKSNMIKSLPRTVHKWLPKLQPLTEPVAKWFPRVNHCPDLSLDHRFGMFKAYDGEDSSETSQVQNGFASNNPLYLLHMDLYGPMRIQSINGKQFVLVVVDDYSRYTWVFFLHSKDEASEVIISFIKKTQVNLQLQVQCVQTDNGTEFKNKTLAKFFDEDVGKPKAKEDIRVFVGYLNESATFRIYNKRTLSQVDEASKKDLDDLFQQFYDEYFDSSKIMKSSTTNVETSINEEVFHEFHDPSNVHTYYQPYPHEKKWIKDHPLYKIIGDPKSSVRTRGQLANSCLFSCLLSSIKPANVAQALRDADWVCAMQEELDQFPRLKVWRLVPRPEGKSGLPKMKFEKDHLCSACKQGKIHRKHHKSKTAFASNKPLYLLYMDLCGLMRVQSINRKRYVLVVVDDYSRYTWRVRTDNGTEFKNKTLAKFFDEVGITQHFSAARTPQQNSVVERRNRTLVEATRTMLTFANLPSFLWAEAIATACFTQNRSIIHKRFDKTPYELINKRKSNIKFFRVFGCRCYLLNEYEDVGKLKEKRDIGVFVGYSKESAAFRIYNKRTLSQVDEASKKDLEDLFQDFYDEYFDSSNIMKSLTTNVETPINEEVFHEVSESFQGESSSSSLNDDVQQSPKEDAYFDASTSFHDPSNVHTFYQPYPHEKMWTKDHPLHKIIGDQKSSVRTRGQLANSCLFSCLLSSIEPANVAKALRDADWVSAMQEELDQFARLKVWRLVQRPEGKSIIKTKWIFKNKKDESSLVIRNKAMLVAVGYS